MTDTNHFYNLLNCIKLKYLHVCDSKVAFYFFSCKPFHIINMLFPFSFIPFFIFYISREVGNDERRQTGQTNFF